MPPKTRRSGGATTGTGNQSTLSFKNKITKSSAATTDPNVHKKAQKIELSSPAQDEVTQAIEIKQSTPEPQIETELAKRTTPTSKGKTSNKEQQPQVELHETSRSLETITKRKKSRRSGDYETSPSESYVQAESQALEITDAQIKKYWKAEEDARLAPRVHQQTLPVQEKILRHFDLSSQYGPCIGTTRLSRWKRAFSLDLDPPLEVLAVLLKEEEKVVQQEKKKSGSGESARLCGKIAYIDELAGGKVVLVE